MTIETDIKCPHCDNNIEADVYEWYSENKMPTEGGYYVSCDDVHFGNPCKYTYQEGIELNEQVYEWFKKHHKELQKVL